MSQNLVRVKDAMNAEAFQFADGMLTVAEGMKLAHKHHVNAIIINKRHDNDEYGIVMLSDIAKQVIARDRSPERVNLYEIMTKPVLSVSPDMDVRYCVRLFERLRIYVAPVIEHDQIWGMVSYTDMVFAHVTYD